MQLPKGVSQKIDEETGEIFYDVVVAHRGKVIAENYGLIDAKDAVDFYNRSMDRTNIEKFTTKTNKIRYRAEFYCKGRAKRKTFATKIEAINWRRDMRVNRDSNDISFSDRQNFDTIDKSKLADIKPSSSFAKFAYYWLNNEASIMRAKNTFKTYERNLRLHVLPILGKIPLNKIEKRMINELQTGLISKELSPGSIHLILAMTSRCIEYACEIDILDKNVMRRFKKVQKTPKDAQYWEENDIKLFIFYIKGTQYFQLFYTALRSGMRKGEILGLKWDAVNFKTRQIKVKRNRTQDELKETTKSNKQRIIPMSSDLLEILSNYKKSKNAKESDYVFTNSRGEEIGYQAINQIFNQCQSHAGVSKIIRFHDLRHTFASQFAMKGGDGKRLQTILGHADAKMTEHYTHLNDTHLMESVEFIENLHME